MINRRKWKGITREREKEQDSNEDKQRLLLSSIMVGKGQINHT
jgi:hypothetical protein